MRLVFAGTPEVAVPSLELLAASDHDLVAVVTRPDAPAGRGRHLEASPVKRWAQEHGIPVLTPQRPGDPDFVAQLRELAPDVCPIVAYGAILTQRVLDVPRLGWVNLHFSVLPAWRGAAPVQRAIMAGDEVTGATTFRVERRLDTGPMFGTMTETIRPDDTSGSLFERLAVGGAGLLARTIDALADGTAVAIPQPAEGITYAEKVEVGEAEVAWGLPWHVLDRRIRGCTPDPGAWSTFRGTRLKIGPIAVGSVPADLGSPLAPGRILVTRRSVLVGTGSEPAELGLVGPVGKRAMAATDWARGARIGPDERLGDG